jgi:hypothetical protein
MRPESQPHTTVSEVAIMVRAHEIWVAAGRPKGDGKPFWSQAELELQRESQSAAWNTRRCVDYSAPPSHRMDITMLQ